jgi:hypothetical protein
MTRDLLIANALAAVSSATPPDKIAVYRRDIEVMLEWVDAEIKARTERKAVRSDEGKDGLRSYKKALEYAQGRRTKLLPSAKPWLRADLPDEIARVETLLAGPPPKKRDAIKKKVAAGAAANLLAYWGLKATSTRGGMQDMLGKALAGIDAAGPSLTDHLKSSNVVPLILVRDRNGSRLLINNSEEARELLQRLRTGGFLSPVGILRPQPSRLRKGARTRRKSPAR